MNNESNPQLDDALKDYLDLWNRNISEGLGRLANAEVRAEMLPAGETPKMTEGWPEGVWIRLFGGKAGEQAFFLTVPDAARMSGFLSSAPPAEEDTLGPDGRESVVQFLQQVATMIPMAEWVGFACELEASDSSKPEWEVAVQAACRLTGPKGPVAVLHALFSPEFASALQAGRDHPQSQEPGPALEQPQLSRTARDINLELLMDVELEVTLRFGHREMLLRDVLNLAPGSVVELEQQVEDPVELLVGSKVIAWGNVVAVEGNYGLRITGLASRKERLESLRK